MRTTILVGKIGPAFRTSTDSALIGGAEFHTYMGSSLSFDYGDGPDAPITRFHTQAIREGALNLGFCYASQEMGVEEFDHLGKWLTDITQVDAIDYGANRGAQLDR